MMPLMPGPHCEVQNLSAISFQSTDLTRNVNGSSGLTLEDFLCSRGLMSFIVQLKSVA